MLNRKPRTIRGEGTNADTETRVRCLSLSFAVQENGDKNTGPSSTTAMATLTGARDGAGGCQQQHNELKFKVHVSNPKLQSRHNNKSNS